MAPLRGALTKVAIGLKRHALFSDINTLSFCPRADNCGPNALGRPLADQMS